MHHLTRHPASHPAGHLRPTAHRRTTCAAAAAGLLAAPVVTTATAGRAEARRRRRSPFRWVDVQGQEQGTVYLVSDRRVRGRRPVVLYHHGFGATADTVRRRTHTPAERRLVERLAAAGYLVVVSDFGGDLWGNDLDHAYLDQAVEIARTRGGLGGPVALVGSSMGGAAVLSYAALHRERAAAVVALMPALDLDAMRWLGDGSLDRAFDGSYDDRVDGPRHSPLVIAERPVASGIRLPWTSGYTDLPVQLWFGTEDRIVTPDSVAAFTSAVRTRVGDRLETVALPGGHQRRTYDAIRPRRVVRFVQRHLPTPGTA